MPIKALTITNRLMAAGRMKPKADRPCASARGYGHRWQKVRLAFLGQHPLCVSCLRQGRTTAANAVDHIIPHRGDAERFWNQANWQALCTTCHNIKTANERAGRGQTYNKQENLHAT